MITERTLKKWRRGALKSINTLNSDPDIFVDKKSVIILLDHILKMTQELLDQHLLRKERTLRGGLEK